MIAIEREAFDAGMAAEMLPLAQKCWAESTEAKAETCAYYGERDFDIEPDIETYQSMQDAGALIVICMRDGGRLVGYVLGFVHASLHHKRIRCGHGDSIYIEPGYRSKTRELVVRFEKEMTAAGVQIIGWPVHQDGPVYGFLKAMGYTGDDVVMEKRLCA